MFVRQCLSDIFLQIVIFSLQLPSNHNTGLSHSITANQRYQIWLWELLRGTEGRLNAQNLLGI